MAPSPPPLSQLPASLDEAPRLGAPPASPSAASPSSLSDQLQSHAVPGTLGQSSWQGSTAQSLGDHTAQAGASQGFPSMGTGDQWSTLGDSGPQQTQAAGLSGPAAHPVTFQSTYDGSTLGPATMTSDYAATMTVRPDASHALPSLDASLGPLGPGRNQSQATDFQMGASSGPRAHAVTYQSDVHGSTFGATTMASNYSTQPTFPAAVDALPTPDSSLSQPLMHGASQPSMLASQQTAPLGASQSQAPGPAQPWNAPATGPMQQTQMPAPPQPPGTTAETRSYAQPGVAQTPPPPPGSTGPWSPGPGAAPAASHQWSTQGETGLQQGLSAGSQLGLSSGSHAHGVTYQSTLDSTLNTATVASAYDPYATQYQYPAANRALPTPESSLGPPGTGLAQSRATVDQTGLSIGPGAHAETYLSDIHGTTMASDYTTQPAAYPAAVSALPTLDSSVGQPLAPGTTQPTTLGTVQTAPLGYSQMSPHAATQPTLPGLASGPVHPPPPYGSTAPYAQPYLPLAPTQPLHGSGAPMSPGNYSYARPPAYPAQQGPSLSGPLGSQLQYTSVSAAPAGVQWDSPRSPQARGTVAKDAPLAYRHPPSGSRKAHHSPQSPRRSPSPLRSPSSPFHVPPTPPSAGSPANSRPASPSANGEQTMYRSARAGIAPQQRQQQKASPHQQRQQQAQQPQQQQRQQQREREQSREGSNQPNLTQILEALLQHIDAKKRKVSESQKRGQPLEASQMSEIQRLEAALSLLATGAGKFGDTSAPNPYDPALLNTAEMAAVLGALPQQQRDAGLQEASGSAVSATPLLQEQGTSPFASTRDDAAPGAAQLAPVHAPKNAGVQFAASTTGGAVGALGAAQPVRFPDRGALLASLPVRSAVTRAATVAQQDALQSCYLEKVYTRHTSPSSKDKPWYLNLPRGPSNRTAPISLIQRALKRGEHNKSALLAGALDPSGLRLQGVSVTSDGKLKNAAEHSVVHTFAFSFVGATGVPPTGLDGAQDANGKKLSIFEKRARLMLLHMPQKEGGPANRFLASASSVRVPNSTASGWTFDKNGHHFIVRVPQASLVAPLRETYIYVELNTSYEARPEDVEPGVGVPREPDSWGQLVDEICTCWTAIPVEDFLDWSVTKPEDVASMASLAASCTPGGLKAATRKYDLKIGDLMRAGAVQDAPSGKADLASPRSPSPGPSARGTMRSRPTLSVRPATISDWDLIRRRFPGIQAHVPLLPTTCVVIPNVIAPIIGYSWHAARYVARTRNLGAPLSDAAVAAIPRLLDDPALADIFCAALLEKLNAASSPMTVEQLAISARMLAAQFSPVLNMASISYQHLRSYAPWRTDRDLNIKNMLVEEAVDGSRQKRREYKTAFLQTRLVEHRHAPLNLEDMMRDFARQAQPYLTA